MSTGIFGGDFWHDLALGILSLIGLWITARGSIAVAKIARGTNEKANATSGALGWAEQLRADVETLKAETKELRDRATAADRVITAATGYIDSLLWWVKTGQRTPMPRPPQIIHDHIDPNLVDLDPPTAHDRAPDVTPGA